MPDVATGRRSAKPNISERSCAPAVAHSSGAGAASRHIAAIHALKHKLRMSDGDYRSLLLHLTGLDSCKAMTLAERQRVREHMQQLVVRMGLERVDQRPQYRRAARPLERKVWALWYALGRAGKLDAPTPAGLQAWIKRQVGVDHLRFCNDEQMHGLIESLKLWQGR